MERMLLERLIKNIEGADRKMVQGERQPEIFELYLHPSVTSNLSGWLGALVVRALLYNFDVDEHRIFKWRIENKYILYLILNHYIPGCMPVTKSLSLLLNERNSIHKIQNLLKNNFFIKAGLGHGSRNNDNFDRTAELEHIIISYYKKDLPIENWILQKKIDIKVEFRIHSFDDEVISGLTFLIQGVDLSDNYLNAEAFVKGILMKLPKTISYGTLIGWDIGLTKNNRYYIIEANFTGFHPEYRRGFQTTGYVDDDERGPIMCAWLNQYFQNRYKISIGSIAAGLYSQIPFFKDFSLYCEMFKKEHLDIVFNKTKKGDFVAIIYLNDVNLYYISRIISYLKLVSFCDNFYVISLEHHNLTIKGLLIEHDHVEIFIESDLFDKNQYLLIQKLSYERRKQACCYRLFRLLNKTKYVVF